MTRSTHPSSHRAVAELASARDRALDAVETVKLGTLATGLRGPAITGTFTFPSPYSTGGAELGLPVLPTVTNVHMSPWASFFPLYNSGTSRMLLYDNTGAEIAAATDVSIMTNRPFEAWTREDAERFLYDAAEAGALRKAQFVVGANLTQSATNYWTLTLVHYSGATRRELGSFATSTLKLAARTLYDLYVPASPFEFTTGDQFHLEVVETGTAPYLGDLTVKLHTTRKVA